MFIFVLDKYPCIIAAPYQVALNVFKYDGKDRQDNCGMADTNLSGANKGRDDFYKKG